MNSDPESRNNFGLNLFYSIEPEINDKNELARLRYCVTILFRNEIFNHCN